MVTRETAAQVRDGPGQPRPWPYSLRPGQWRAPLEVSELIAPVGALLPPCQPAQRHFVLDERHVRADDLPMRNLMSAVIRLEQSRSLRDMERVAQALRPWPQATATCGAHSPIGSGRSCTG